MAKQTKHVHKYRRHRHKSGNIIFFCALPDCNSKINPALALGKKSICWRCGSEFILSEYAIRLAKPHCDACHKPKSEVDTNIIQPRTDIANVISKLNQDEVVIERRAEPRVSLDKLDEIADVLQMNSTPEPVIEKANEIESGLRHRLNHLVKPDDEDI